MTKQASESFHIANRFDPSFGWADSMGRKTQGSLYFLYWRHQWGPITISISSPDLPPVVWANDPSFCWLNLSQPKFVGQVWFNPYQSMVLRPDPIHPSLLFLVLIWLQIYRCRRRPSIWLNLSEEARKQWGTGTNDQVIDMAVQQ